MLTFIILIIVIWLVIVGLSAPGRARKTRKRLGGANSPTSADG